MVLLICHSYCAGAVVNIFLHRDMAYFLPNLLKAICIFVVKISFFNR